MAQGLPGADSSSPVTASVVAAATALFGRTPAVWGRYFTKPTTSGSVEYRHAQENPVLAQYGIRLLPVARQTRDTAGSTAQGTADAQGNVDDLFDSFGADYLASLGSEFLMFLDVEVPPRRGAPRWDSTTGQAGRRPSASTAAPPPAAASRSCPAPTPGRATTRPGTS